MEENHEPGRVGCAVDLAEAVCQSAQAVKNPALAKANGWQLEGWTVVILKGATFFIQHDSREATGLLLSR